MNYSWHHSLLAVFMTAFFILLSGCASNQPQPELYTFNDYVGVVAANGLAVTRTINQACAAKQLSELQCTRIKGRLREAFEATKQARALHQTASPKEALDQVSLANSILNTIDQLLAAYGADHE